MPELIRTDSSNPDFVILVRELDRYLAIVDGEEHGFYDQYNQIDDIKHVVICYINGTPVSCGAIKSYDEQSMEVKRMFTSIEERGHGYAAMVLKELEAWAEELGFTSCILETGMKQKEAIRLYQRSGYETIPNYGQYKDVANSLCFEKVLI